MINKLITLLIVAFAIGKLNAQTMPCTGVAVSGDYRYEIYTNAGTVYFKMTPLGAIVGSNSAIIYIKEGTATGVFPGYNMTKTGGDFVFNKQIADGTSVNFYFSYQVPAGGEANSSANPHQYLAGDSCVGGAPTVSILAPEEALRFTAPASMTIHTTALDADGTISRVQFFNGNVLLGSDDEFPYSFNWTNVPTGDYTIEVKATDNSGITTAAVPVHIVVHGLNSNGFCGTGFNGEYEYKVETASDTIVTVTFKPIAPLTSTYALVYIRTGISGTYPGNYMAAAPNNTFKYTQNFLRNEPLNLYFTYQISTGGEHNSSLNPHHYIVGNACGVLADHEIETATNVFSIYPNPAQDRLFVKYLATNLETSEARILNVYGQILEKMPVSALINGFDMAHFPAGMYQIQLIDKKTKNTFSQKFIKI